MEQRGKSDLRLETAIQNPDVDFEDWTVVPGIG